jgi:putative endonuclease
LRLRGENLMPTKYSMHNKQIGQWGERAAADYLIEKGYELLAANVRTPYGEIDLVLRSGEITIFVEVKTRTSNRLGVPEESVTARKQEHMLAAAEHYAAEQEIDHWQIDVISVEGKPGTTPLVTHFENAL